jgi:hypothetical protein
MGSWSWKGTKLMETLVGSQFPRMISLSSCERNIPWLINKNPNLDLWSFSWHLNDHLNACLVWIEVCKSKTSHSFYFKFSKLEGQIEAKLSLQYSSKKQTRIIFRFYFLNGHWRALTENEHTLRWHFLNILQGTAYYSLLDERLDIPISNLIPIFLSCSKLEPMSPHIWYIK